MWKVLLALVSHRLLLLAIALIAINSATSVAPAGRMIKPIQPLHVLLQSFEKKVSECSEALTLRQLDQRPVGDVFNLTHNPFFWINRLAIGVLHFPTTLSLLLFSNLFLFLFLWELYVLVERLAIPEVGTGAAIFAILWVTSYELSLGASLSMSCFLLMMAIRHAIDNQWLLAGLGLGLLGLVEPMAVALLPVLLFVFWYFQRHFQMSQVIKRACFFLIPVGFSILAGKGLYSDLKGIIDGSALLNIVQLAHGGKQWTWALSQSYLGQTLSIAFFLVGAICAAVMNTSILYRIIPMYVLIVVLLFTPFGMVGSRLSLAAVCLGGIAAVSSGLVTRLLQLLLVILGAIEVVSIFS